MMIDHPLAVTTTTVTDATAGTENTTASATTTEVATSSVVVVVNDNDNNNNDHDDDDDDRSTSTCSSSTTTTTTTQQTDDQQDGSSSTTTTTTNQQQQQQLNNTINIHEVEKLDVTTSSPSTESTSTSMNDIKPTTTTSVVDILLPQPPPPSSSIVSIHDMTTPKIRHTSSTTTSTTTTSTTAAGTTSKRYHHQQRLRSNRSIGGGGGVPKNNSLHQISNINDDSNSYTTINQRLVEYFCVVTSVPCHHSQQQQQQPQEQEQEIHESSSSMCENDDNNNNNNNGGNIHMPLVGDPSSLPDTYNNNHQQNNTTSNNKTRTNNTTKTTTTFIPTITARYPEIDYDDNPFNPMILHFCFPFFRNNSNNNSSGSANDVIIHGTTEYALPRVHHFVLTLGCGHKMYGTCLTVHEEYDENEHDQNNEMKGQQHPDLLSDASNEFGGTEIQRAETTDSIRQATKNASKTRRPTIYVPKVLCLLSTWPYLTAFREYLSQLYRLAVMTNCMTAPIERYIVNVCCEIPAPPPGAYEIQVPILNSMIRFWAPPAKLPIAYTALPYHILFECLDIDHIILVWSALILERKVLLMSRQYSILTVSAEIFCSLLFPLRWSHLYVPMLPQMLCPMLDAPVPYLCGIVRENWNYAKQYVGQGSEITYVVDLDRNTIKLMGGSSTSGQDPIPPFPPRKMKKLRTALQASVGEVFWRVRGMEDAYRKEMNNRSYKRNWDTLRMNASEINSSQWEEKLNTFDYAFNLAYTPESLNLHNNNNVNYEEQSQWDRVQEGFLRFFVALLKNYRSYLVKPEKSSTNEPTFNQAAFMANLQVENKPFMTEFCQTQHYQDFLSRRLYSPGEPDLVFFDQSIDAKLNRSKMKLKKVETPFLHAAKVHKELTKLPAVPPNEESLPFRCSDGRKMPFLYNKIPEKLDNTLFCTPRPIPKIISAEFDRQAILVSRLRANILPTDQLLRDAYNNSSNVDSDRSEIEKFYKGDYDPSPEVASFMVFLFVYSSMVGQDWQKYSQKRRIDDAMKPPTISYDDKDQQQQQRDETIVTEETVANSKETDPSGNNVSINETCCGADCAESGVIAITSTMSYLGSSIEDLYSSYFRKQTDEIYASLSMHEDKDMMSVPETDDAAAEYEEAREVAAAQLEVAFATLATMSLRGLSVDSDVYFSLMEACGRCGDIKRAMKLIELMKKDGFVADSEVVSCFIAAFAHNDIRHQEKPAIHDELTEKNFDDYDAYSLYLRKGLENAKEEKQSTHCLHDTSGMTDRARSPSGIAKNESINDSVSGEDSDWSSTKSSVESSSVPEWKPLQTFRIRKNKKRKHKRRSGDGKYGSTILRPVTEMITRHIELAENLLDFVYPDLVIDTNSDSCPHCSYILNEGDVVDGWKPCAFQDYTTSCPKCKHRFVPRFVVQCTSPVFMGSQGNQTPLYCEFLSPWVLRKEFHHILKEQGNHHYDKNGDIIVGSCGIDTILDPEWRSGTDICATLFWNFIVCCRRYSLPYTFLLQGNFHNRLILPRKPNEI